VGLLRARLCVELLGRGPASLLGRAGIDVLVHLYIHFGDRGRNASGHRSNGNSENEPQARWS
jgi:hypothetical protein